MNRILNIDKVRNIFSNRDLQDTEIKTNARAFHLQIINFTNTLTGGPPGLNWLLKRTTGDLWCVFITQAPSHTPLTKNELWLKINNWMQP